MVYGLRLGAALGPASELYNRRVDLEHCGETARESSLLGK